MQKVLGQIEELKPKEKRGGLLPHVLWQDAQALGTLQMGSVEVAPRCLAWEEHRKWSKVKVDYPLSMRCVQGCAFA